MADKQEIKPPEASEKTTQLKIDVKRLDEVVLPKLSPRISTVSCHSPHSEAAQEQHFPRRLTNQEASPKKKHDEKRQIEEKIPDNPHRVKREFEDFVDKMKSSVLEEISATQQEPERTPEQILEVLDSAGAQLGPKAQHWRKELEAALKKEANSTGPDRLHRDSMLSAFGISELRSLMNNNKESQFALGALVTMVRKEETTTTNDKFVSAALELAENKETKLAVLKLALESKAQFSGSVLSDCLEDSDLDIVTAAAKVWALQEGQIQGFDDIKPPVAHLPRNKNERFMEEMFEMGRFPATLESGLSVPDSKMLRQHNLQALEVIAARPDIEIPGGLDSLLSRLIEQKFPSEETRSRFSMLSRINPRGNDYDQHLSRLVMQLSDEGRLESPIEHLRSLMKPNSPLNSEIFQFIEQRPELASKYKIADIIADRQGMGTADFSNTGSFYSSLGNDSRLASVLGHRMKHCFPELSLDGLEATTLNILTYVQSQYPRTWDSLVDNGKVEDLAKGLSQFVRDEQNKLVQDKRIIMGPGVRFTTFAHEESRFDLEAPEEWAKRYQMEYLGAAKGQNDIFESMLEKEGFLENVSSIAGDSTKTATIYVGAHGGPNHFYLEDGTIDRALSEDMNKPFAVSYVELAKTMVEAQLSRGKEAIDLSHCNILLDACIQHDFICGFREEVHRLADEQEVDVQGLPLMVSASQAGQPGFATPFTIYREELQRQMPQDGSPLTVEHLLATDRALNDRYKDVLELPAAEQRLPRHGEDPALFSPHVAPTHRIHRILKELLAPDSEEAIKADIRAKPSPWSNEVGSLYNGVTLKALV